MGVDVPCKLPAGSKIGAAGSALTFMTTLSPFFIQVTGRWDPKECSSEAQRTSGNQMPPLPKHKNGQSYSENCVDVSGDQLG